MDTPEQQSEQIQYILTQVYELEVDKDGNLITQEFLFTPFAGSENIPPESYYRLRLPKSLEEKLKEKNIAIPIFFVRKKEGEENSFDIHSFRVYWDKKSKRLIIEKCEWGDFNLLNYLNTRYSKEEMTQRTPFYPISEEDKNKTSINYESPFYQLPSRCLSNRFFKQPYPVDVYFINPDKINNIQSR